MHIILQIFHILVTRGASAHDWMLQSPNKQKKKKKEKGIRNKTDTLKIFVPLKLLGEQYIKLREIK